LINEIATYYKVNYSFISWKCFIVIYLQIHRHTNKISQFWSVCLWFSRKTNVKRYLIGYWTTKERMIGLKLIKRFWVSVISPSRLKIDLGRCPESDITLARHKHRWGKNWTFAILSNSFLRRTTLYNSWLWNRLLSGFINLKNVIYVFKGW
jgi:hypothetical protein